MRARLLIPHVDRSREAFLERTIQSVDHPDVFILIQDEHRVRGYVRPINEMVKMCKNDDVIILGNDDIVFDKGVLGRALKLLEMTFTDGDGILGLATKNEDVARSESLKYPFPVIGRKFLERFPQQLLCPDYNHWYGDTELGEYAESIGRFVYAPSMTVFHDREDYGMVDNEQMRKEARPLIDTDHQTRRVRKSRGYLWGKNFNRIHG